LGKRKVVIARFVHNDRLIDALMAQAFAALTASPGAHAFYDAQRAKGLGHNDARGGWPAGLSASAQMPQDPHELPDSKETLRIDKIAVQDRFPYCLLYVRGQRGDGHAGARHHRRP
jgi:hypothetical protein